MKHTHFQAGKGMSGFFLGMIIATMAIAGVLFFLNTNKTTFQQHETARAPAQPEILTPEGSNQTTPPPVPINPEDSTEGTSPSDEAKPPKPAEPDSKPEPEETPKPEGDKAETKPAPPADKPKTDKPADKPKTAARPTPDQILESGSLEKAQQAAKEKAAKEEAKQAQAAKEKTAAAKAQGGKARLQVGSFKNSTAADEQRAKLAMLGVNTTVVKGTGADGQTVYRVQTGSMSRQQAEQTAQRLKQNQIDSLVRSAQ
ncbi:cell division protein FtsN [Neisseria sp. HSC-16F19]|nr:SPOR domain-containing protein [Neisseria sp. HSC-16F19]MCP2040169.1 cell division protein FtsN [Neisseria sp. HSC-16F19]